MTRAVDSELQLLVEQLSRMYESLAAIRQEVAPRNPALYHVMAEGPLDEIRKLQEEIDELTGVAELREEAAELWLRIEGADIELHSAPTSILTAILDAFRKGVQSVAEFIDRGMLSVRPTKELKDATDMRIVAFAPGSLQVGLRLPDEPPQIAVTAGRKSMREVVEQAIREYLTVAEWAAARGDRDLAQLVPHAHHRVLLNAVKPLLPRKRGAVTLVELRGRLTQQRGTILLTRESHDQIDKALDQLVTEEIETHRGVLREIDLDAQTFQLRKPDDSVFVLKCSFPEEFFEAAKEALDRLVEVTGTRAVVEGRRRASTLTIARLEIVEEDSSASP